MNSLLKSTKLSKSLIVAFTFIIACLLNLFLDSPADAADVFSGEWAGSAKFKEKGKEISGRVTCKFKNSSKGDSIECVYWIYGAYDRKFTVSNQNNATRITFNENKGSSNYTGWLQLNDDKIKGKIDIYNYSKNKKGKLKLSMTFTLFQKNIEFKNRTLKSLSQSELNSILGKWSGKSISTLKGKDYKGSFSLEVSLNKKNLFKGKSKFQHGMGSINALDSVLFYQNGKLYLKKEFGNKYYDGVFTVSKGQLKGVVNIHERDSDGASSLKEKFKCTLKRTV